MRDAFGHHSPGLIDRAVIAATTRLPANWLGLRLAIGLRRVVTMRLNGQGLDVVRWGLNMRLHPGDNGCEKNLLYTPQMFEPQERRVLACAMREGFVFVDIGANVGLFSLFVASMRREGTRIIAVEPEPGNVERLKFNIASNGSLPIEVCPVALGSTSGTASVILNGKDRGGTTVADAGGQAVDRLTLLELLRKQNVSRIDALKIDTEATEDQILAPFFRDAPDTLLPSLIIIEDSRHAWDTDLFEGMVRLGYVETARSRFNVIMKKNR
jgi:FkbM family methyltransferase